MIETPLPQRVIETRRITRKQQLSGTTLSRWSLPLILAFQTLFSWILLQNTPFQDEALYVYAGRQIWQQWLGGPPSLDHYSYYFSGYPYVYPIIGGGLDLLGGLELARSFSLVCMLLVTTCGYYVTKKLFNQKSDLFAAIFFVCQEQAGPAALASSGYWSINGASIWREICCIVVYPICSCHFCVMCLAQAGMDKYGGAWDVGSTFPARSRNVDGYCRDPL